MKLIRASLFALSTLALGAAFAAEPSPADLEKQATITKTQAEHTALAMVKGGKIQSSEIENERGHLVWSFDITQPGKKSIREILVDAKTGKVIHTETEGPKAQAKEAAQEAKETKH